MNDYCQLNLHNLYSTIYFHLMLIAQKLISDRNVIYIPFILHKFFPPHLYIYKWAFRAHLQQCIFSFYA